jgi:small subunit ribosomal protein S6
MTLPAPTYDLVLILDPQGEESVRAKIVADTRAAIEAGGELLRHDDWGERPLAYPIERRAGGEYHLMQFHAGGAELMSSLDRTLRLTDGILRFRIIRLAPGVPDAPDMPAASAVRRPEAEAAPTESAAAPEAAEALAQPAAGEQPAPEATEPAPAEVAVGDPA